MTAQRDEHLIRIAYRLGQEIGGELARPLRVFVASPQEIQCVEVPPGVEEAYDMMAFAGVPSQQAADMAMACHRSGRDPVAFARHFVRLRKASRSAGA